MRCEQTKSPNVPLQSVETCQTMYRNQSLACFYHKSSLMFQLENFFVFRSAMERKLTVTWSAHGTLQAPDSKSPHSRLLHSRSIKQGSKDCWHLVEALRSATWPISHCIFSKEWVEKWPTSDFPLLGWIFFSVFWVSLCHRVKVAYPWAIGCTPWVKY